MPEATLKFVAKLAGVAPVTVSRVINGSEKVAETTREKILAIIRELNYTPNVHAANLRRKSLNAESTSGSKHRSLCGHERLRAGSKSSLSVSWPPEAALILSPEEGRTLAQEMIRLRRDLDKLRKHTERIQCMIQEAILDDSVRALRIDAIEILRAE
jgi:hypothetical protein